MIYCPSCKKPSARTEGACPHCGANLNSPPANPANPQRRSPAASSTRIGMGPPAAPPARTSAAPARPVGPPSSSGSAAGSFGGADLDLHDGGDDMPLELDSDDRPMVAGVSKAYHEANELARSGGAKRQAPTDELSASPSQQKPVAAPRPIAPESNRLAEPELISDADVQMLGGFGRPEDGILGVVKYGWKVRTRLKDLNPRFEAAKTAREAAWAELETAKSTFGREVVRAGVVPAELETLVARAKKTDDALQGAKSAESALNAEHEARLADLDQKIRAVDLEAEPIRAEEIKARSEVDTLLTAQKRAMARVKRTEIELRNLRELIESRQKDYADLQKPKEERDRLLKEIAMYDNQQPALKDRLAEEQAGFDELTGPLQKRNEVLAEVMGRLAAKNEQMAAFRREKETLTQAHNQTMSAAQQKTRGESEQSAKAWGAVGESAFLSRLYEHPSLKEAGGVITGKRLAFLKAQREQELFERAVIAYDHQTYDQANKYMMIGGAGLGVLIVILIIVSM